VQDWVRIPHARRPERRVAVPGRGTRSGEEAPRHRAKCREVCEAAEREGRALAEHLIRELVRVGLGHAPEALGHHERRRFGSDHHAGD
jgi:S-adenosylmethionine:diacylglycerol 3-amino-3-carboxypropyl transferase